MRGSPAYCKKLLSNLLAMIRQLGAFTFFLTLSAADLRWPDTICVRASQYNVSLTEQDVKDMTWKGRCHWIGRNPVTAARQFDYRVQLFVKHVLRSGVIGEIDDYLYRVEFQARGSSHIHMVIWIKEAQKYESDSDEDIANFDDKHISCSLSEDNHDLRDLVNGLQRHVHSTTCRKKGKTCRFAFPRPPSDNTIICRGSSPCNPVSVQDHPSGNDVLDSQGNTHHSASEQESLPQETDSDWFSHQTESQPDIEVDDKTSVNQKALLNKVFDAMFKMDITQDTTLEEILKAVDVPLKEYEQAL